MRPASAASGLRLELKLLVDRSHVHSACCRHAHAHAHTHESTPTSTHRHVDHVQTQCRVPTANSKSASSLFDSSPGSSFKVSKLHASGRDSSAQRSAVPSDVLDRRTKPGSSARNTSWCIIVICACTSLLLPRSVADAFHVSVHARQCLWCSELTSNGYQVLRFSGSGPVHTMAKAQFGHWIISKHPTKQSTSLRPQPHKTRGGRRRRRRRASIAFGLRCMMRGRLNRPRTRGSGPGPGARAHQSAFKLVSSTSKRVSESMHAKG